MCRTKSLFVLYKHAWISTQAPHLTQKISGDRCSEILKQGGLLLRNTYDFDCKKETSFWFVIKDRFVGFEELSSKVRNQVRKSLKTYDIRRVSLKDLESVGYYIFSVAQESYRIKCSVLSKEQYRAIIQSYSEDKFKEFWCVYRKDTGKAVALSINTVKDNCCEYNTLKALPSALHDSTYPYYGLIFEMNRHYLEERGLMYVNDGARSLTEHSNIQNFLESKFKFRKAYCRLQVVYQWWFGIIVRCLYPFRNFMPILSVKSILRLEEYRRSDM
jgi:hypothetical protein